MMCTIDVLTTDACFLKIGIQTVSIFLGDPNLHLYSSIEQNIIVRPGAGAARVAWPTQQPHQTSDQLV